MVLKVGLTGGIASGKSYVSRILELNGASIIDADKLAKRVVVAGSPVLKEIVTVFGTHVIDSLGELKRDVLREIVFNDAVLLDKLNRIIHPRVIREQNIEITLISAVNPDAVIVVDAPLLIEAGYHKELDILVVVYVRREIQIQRLIQRDNIDENEAVRIIDLQMSLEEKAALADHVIDNNGSRVETRVQTVELYDEWVTGMKKQ